jgi:exopolyphosphatase / guanosine-5'-triphosphate,3'-diphosphate pyrophosphatase
MLGRAMADHHEVHAGLVELVEVTLQLHGVLAAEGAAEVPQPYEGRGTLLPGLAQPHLVAVVVAQHGFGEVARVAGRVRVLACPWRSRAGSLGVAFRDVDAARPTRTAVVDLGTNSTRLLVAEVREAALAELDRRTNVTRLGEGVDSTNRLSEAAMERVRAVCAEYREAIDRLGAERVVAVATSAFRDAENGEEFRRELRERFGIDARTISGDEEARLTFLGAVSARPRGEEPLLVLDIGGGSTEVVVGVAGAEPEFRASLRAGSVRQTERHLRDDPPPPDQVAACAQEIRALIVADVPSELRARTSAGIAVAGTATSLAAIDQELDPYDPERVHGYRLELGACERMLAMLAALPLERRRELPGLHPDRAPTIVAGALILLEATRAFDLEAWEVSEWDILHGAALAAAWHEERPPSGRQTD